MDLLLELLPSPLLLTAALFLAGVNERLIEVLVAPWWELLKDKVSAKLYALGLITISWVTGLGLGLVSGINLFAAVIPDPTVGLVLSAVAIGAGSNYLHEVFGSVQATKVARRNGGGGGCC